MSRAGRDGERDGEEQVAAQRLDKWLWFARLAKTRTQAAALVADGHVRINRERVSKPGATVKVGDVVTATVHRTVRVLKVAAFIVRRGPAAEAMLTYEELTPAADRPKALARDAAGPPTAQATERAHAGRQPGAGRPTKRDRRRIDRLREPSP